MRYRIFGILVLLMLLTASKCSSEPDPTTEPPRDRTKQYNQVERDSIMGFMQTHRYTLDAQFNIEIDTLDDPSTQVSLWDDPNKQTLQVVDPKVKSLTYDLFYIPFRTGTGKQLTKYDNFFTAYKGILFDNTVFDERTDYFPTWFVLKNKYSNGKEASLIDAWQEVLPNFKDGTFVDNGDGTVTFQDFGAGMLITPSGLGYYERATGKIKPYSPLIFSFKIFIVDQDNDNDLVKNMDEDLDGDGNPLNDDTDNDKVFNINDKDDDNDGVLTKNEDANGDGDPTNDDSDGDGVPDYLDKDTR